jgi:hypothetical protein
MFKKISLTVVLALLLSAFAFVAQAQEALEAGVTVNGEITDDTPAVEYTYEGKEGQVIVVELFPVDITADYDQPKIIVNNSEGEEIFSYGSFGETMVAVVLPAADTYTIIATRDDETSVGEYTLTLLVPQELAIGDTVEGTVSTEVSAYYVVRSEDDFAVGFAREGVLPIEFTVNKLDITAFTGQSQQGILSGAQVVRGSLGNFAGGEVYLLYLTEPLFYFTLEVDEATFGLAIAEPLE